MLLFNSQQARELAISLIIQLTLLRSSWLVAEKPVTKTVGCASLFVRGGIILCFERNTAPDKGMR